MLYEKLIGHIDFFVCENIALIRTILFARFIAYNSRYLYCKYDYGLETGFNNSCLLVIYSDSCTNDDATESRARY